MNLLELSTQVHDKQSAIIFLQEHRILHEQHRCSNGHLMTQVEMQYSWMPQGNRHSEEHAASRLETRLSQNCAAY